MYPRRDLNRLAGHKATVRRRIARHRAECVEALTAIARPIHWLDRALAFMRRISPLMVFAAVPAGFLLKRTGSSRLKLVGALVKWVPMVFSILRGVSPAFKSRAVPTKS